MYAKLADLQRSLQASPLTEIDDPWLRARDITLSIKRDDLLHPIMSGNKWRKLKYILQHAASVQAHTLLSMGGAYSNHLHALAYAGMQLGINTVGYIRGDARQPLTPTLQDIQAWGMQLRFINRSEYRALRHYQHWQALPGIAAGEYWLPEGGASALALQGIAELMVELPHGEAVLCVPCGTGTTLAGMIANSHQKQNLLGFAALKNAAFLNDEVRNLLPNPDIQTPWSINLEYHGGGFAKTTPVLVEFMHRFGQLTGITLDQVYTGKMLFGIYDLIAKGYFQTGQHIKAVTN